MTTPKYTRETYAENPELFPKDGERVYVKCGGDWNCITLRTSNIPDYLSEFDDWMPADEFNEAISNYRPSRFDLGKHVIYQGEKWTITATRINRDKENNHTLSRKSAEGVSIVSWVPESELNAVVGER